MCFLCFFFFKQKTAYEMRISDWSSDVCSSDLRHVEEKSGGNFTIKVHYGEAISPAKENLDGLKIGAFEMASICTGYQPGKNPAMTVLDLPSPPIPTLENQQTVSESLSQHAALKTAVDHRTAGHRHRRMLTPGDFTDHG